MIFFGILRCYHVFGENVLTEKTQRGGRLQAKDKKRLSAIIVAGIALIVGFGAYSIGNTSPSPTITKTVARPVKFQPNSTVTIGSEVFPVTLDPTANASAAIDEVIDYNVLQHLVELNPKGSIVPVLATSWSVSQNNSVYTFQIRKGVRFSNGDPLTAADVVFSMKRVFASGSTYPYGKLFDVSSVTALGPYSVSVHLTKPSWEWLFNLAAYSNGVIVDPKTIGQLSSDPIGTGPYKVVSERNNYSITLTRNPYYYGPTPRAKSVVFRYFSNPNTEDAALESGQIQVIDNLGTPSEVSVFKNSSKYKVITGPTNGKVQLTLNNSYGPLSNVLVRRAIAYATDKKAVIQVASGGYGSPLGSDSVPADPYYLNLANAYPYNPARAKALLAQAGYSHGFPLTITLPPYPYAQLAGPLLASELDAVGIRVKLTNIQWPLWISQVFEGGNFQATIIDHAEARDIGNYGTPGYYWHYNGTPQVAKMLSQSNSAPTRSQWIKGYRAVLEKITGAAVNDWLYILPQITVTSSTITGVPTSGYSESFNLSYIGVGGRISKQAQNMGF